MSGSITNQVVDFYHELFGRLFGAPFEPLLAADRRKRNLVRRQVEESADAASQSLERFFRNEQLSEDQVAGILDGLAPVGELLRLDDISNPHFTPEAVVEDLLGRLSCPSAVRQARQEAIYRVALHTVVQVLMLAGPLMAEWQRLSFSSQFDLLRRVNDRLNQISEHLDILSGAGQDAADERYELTYRDYLLQRFYRVEAGTVRMTTNMNVDLRELFVMPRVLPRPPRPEAAGEGGDIAALMNLAAARRFFGEHMAPGKQKPEDKPGEGVAALEQVRQCARNVIVGAPGGGKSTFLEWLQLQVADAAEELVEAAQQVIPLLLRVRQLDPRRLPTGAALVEKATASHDRATLMPSGWIERQLRKGVVLFMLDGLDETEPELVNDFILPWLGDLCRQYPQCRYLVSSRPVGYPAGLLQELGFTECDLLDFNEAQIAEYTRHWCTAVRLARNEAEPEARREGAADGAQIVAGFTTHPYIRDLARNPLMLSAVCLVNYFEQGNLPTDRALLYNLCVEGLLHHWDQRRGIHSEFTLAEKLRVVREVALAMQADDRAEYEADKVQGIMEEALNDAARADQLMEHIRYRTGLLIERRAGVFAFAHLTFQEYLAALAVHEGNRRGIDAERLAEEHEDGRWKEVIALYCGLAPAPAARAMIERLMAQPDTHQLSTVLTEAYLSSGAELSLDENRPLAKVSESEFIVVESGNQIEAQREALAPVAIALG